MCTLMICRTSPGARFVEGRPFRGRSSHGAISWVWVVLMLQLLSGGGVQQLITQVSAQGSWNVLVQNAGIASMHTAVTSYGTVILLDRTDIGPSQINLPNKECRDDPNDVTLTHDCTAHSVEFTIATKAIRPLFIKTDTWCSSGQFDPNGVLVQTGGDLDGLFKIRRFYPCSDGDCDWVEDETTQLQQPRWYATNQLLPDGRQILIGGRSAPYVEFVPPDGTTYTTLELLVDTNDYQQDNLYPFVHLLPNGYLFIFANTESIIYDYFSATTVSQLPTLGGTPRNYPSAGSSVMLPLQSSDGFSTAEIVVCGGAQLGAFSNPGANLGAANDCGRITATDSDPEWVTEYMPIPRTMGDMIMLPSGTTLIINGAQVGSQGWGDASDPAYNPVNYDPNADLGSRFTVWTATDIPRVYHSTANLLPDGRILICGSNTHQYYTFTGVFPTELRVEAFSPPYLDGDNDPVRPGITASPTFVGYGDAFTVTVSIENAPTGNVNLILNSSPFSTHSFSQGQRQVVLAVGAPESVGGNSYSITATGPPSGIIAPGAWYMLFAVNEGIPSQGNWVHIG